MGLLLMARVHTSRHHEFTFVLSCVIFVIISVKLGLLSWGSSGVVVSTLGFRSKNRWFEAQSLPSCCFLKQETSLHIVSLHPGV